MRHTARFRADRSNRCRDMAFLFFNMAAICHLGFVVRLLGTTHKYALVVFIVVHNLTAIGSVVLKICELQYYGSLD